jgi:hypothetical protein
MESLTNAADDLAMKAEKEHSVTLSIKSNALHRAAKEKNEQQQNFSQQIDEKLLAL